MTREPIAICCYCGHRCYVPAGATATCHTCDLLDGRS